MPTLIASINDKQYKWSFEGDGSILLDGKIIQADIQKISSGRFSLILNGRSFHGTITRNDLIYGIIIHGNIYRVGVETSGTQLAVLRSAALPKKHSATEVRSPMPGMVVRCEVKEGERVEAGDGLLVLEAMKMENEIRATKEGIIKKVHVVDRQVVNKGELLFLIE